MVTRNGFRSVWGEFGASQSCIAITIGKKVKNTVTDVAFTHHFWCIITLSHEMHSANQLKGSFGTHMNRGLFSQCNDFMTAINRG